MAPAEQPNEPIDNETTGGEREDAIYMDDTTGSDGGATADKPDEIGRTRTDTGRTEGPGSPDDTEPAQSSGRSQY